MRVLVIGAAGFVGRKVVQAIRQSGLGDVVSGVRRPDGNPDSCVLEATNIASVTAALRGVTHTINCVLGPANVMTESTRVICEAALTARLQRVVHFSSCAVYGSATGVIREDAPYGNDGDWYVKSKIECEAIVGDFMRKGLSAVILRPSCIYGPGSEQWSGRVGRLLKTRRLGDLGVLGDGRCNLVHVDDVAQAVVNALRNSIGGEYIFNLSNPEPPRWNDYLMRYARVLGAVPVRRIPGWQIKTEQLMAPPLKITQIIAAKLHLPVKFIPDPLTPSFLRNCRIDAYYDGRKASTTLGLAYTPLDKGLTQAAAWLQQTSNKKV